MRRLLRRLLEADLSWEFTNFWSDPDSRGTFQLVDAGGIRERWEKRSDTIPPTAEVIQFGIAVLNFGAYVTLSWES